ncbi:MAG TPA: pitrilysin family protein [Xanthobacteraceae bacterium]|jgi:zinc protease|nr:pitrilysin family protein [Xanthobacteraceae bacterium]
MTLHEGYGVMRRVLFALPLLALAVGPAGATSIERVISPGGIEAWLVRQPSVPLVAMDFAMIGGANEDPADKAGVAHLVASTIDEGAGDLDAKAYHQRLEDNAIELSFAANRDHFRGSLRTLTVNRDLAFDTLRLSLTAPRFDDEAVERIRTQILADLRRATTSPGEIASEVWWRTAFPDHPYGRPVHGTLESVPRITIADLKAYAKRVFARATLKIAIVGDIDAATAGLLIDKAFGGLPEQPELGAIPSAAPQGLGRRIVVDLDVPQSVIMFGGPGVARNDPDFFPAYLVNHILGGGTMSSRLYTEVREKRGLAYGVSTALVPLAHAQLLSGSTATRADRTADTLEIIDREMKNLAENGPTEQELDKTKSFLKGSYGLYFDTSSKIAAQLVQIQLDNLGIDYIDRRNGLIDAVTRADAQRVAKRLLDGEMLVTVVGRPQGVISKDVSATGSGG